VDASSSLYVVEFLEKDKNSEIVLHCVGSSCNECFLFLDALELYRVFRKKVDAREVAVDLVSRVKLQRHRGNIQILLSPGSHDSPAPIPETFTQEECIRRLQHTSNIIAHKIRCIGGKNGDITILNDAECPEAMVCIHVFLVVVRIAEHYYALKVNDDTFRETLPAGDLYLLHPSGRHELVQKCMNMVTLRKDVLILDPKIQEEEKQDNVWPVEVGSTDHPFAQWEEMKMDKNVDCRLIQLGERTCEIVLYTTAAGHFVAFCVPALQACTVLHVPYNLSLARIYLEVRVLRGVKFAFLLWEKSFPHTLMIHVQDVVTQASASVSESDDKIYEMCPLSYMKTLGVLGERLLIKGAVMHEPIFVKTPCGRQQYMADNVIRLLQPGAPQKKHAWQLLYSASTRLNSDKGKEKKREDKREPHMNITLARKAPREFSFMLTVKKRSVNRSFGRRGGISTKGDTRLFVPDQETFTLECGSVESMNLYAEIRTLAGIPLLIFVAQDSSPPALRLSITCLLFDWSLEIHVCEGDSTPDENAHLSLLHLFKKSFGQAECKLKFTPQEHCRKLLYRETGFDGHPFVFSVVQVVHCQSKDIAVELKLLFDAKEHVLCLKGEILDQVLTACEVPEDRLEDYGTYVGRSLLRSLIVDRLTHSLRIKDPFKPIDNDCLDE